VVQAEGDERSTEVGGGTSAATTGAVTPTTSTDA
jgi:hypothetical protein